MNKRRIPRKKKKQLNKAIKYLNHRNYLIVMSKEVNELFQQCMKLSCIVDTKETKRMGKE